MAGSESGDQAVELWIGGGFFGAGAANRVLLLAGFAEKLAGRGVGSAAECAFGVHRCRPHKTRALTPFE